MRCDIYSPNTRFIVGYKLQITMSNRVDYIECFNNNTNTTDFVLEQLTYRVHQTLIHRN